MKRPVHLPLPALEALQKLGADIRDARRRRRVPIALMAERVGVSQTTIGKIERGDPTASMGSYTLALFVLGFTERLSDLADGSVDLTGRFLEEERLPQRIRLSKKKEKRKKP